MKVLVDRLGRVLSSPLFDDRFGAGRGQRWLHLRDVVLRCACAIGLGVSLAPVAVVAAVPAIPVVVAVPFSPTNPLFMASQLPLSYYGYVEEEFFIQGSAHTYASPLGSTPQITSTLPYQTRILVRRPADSKNYSGHVILEPLHPSHSAPSLAVDFRWIYANGDVWVGVEPPANNALLQTFNKARYGTLTANAALPVYDILSQVAALVQSSLSPIPMLRVRSVFMQGVSATCSTVSQYVISFHANTTLANGHPIVDGYFPGECSTLLPDVNVPVIRINTQLDFNAATRKADSDNPSGRYRLYEVAGANHLASSGPQFGENLGILHAIGVTGSIGDTISQCQEFGPPLYAALNDFPIWTVYDAAMRNLQQWVDHGVRPPRESQPFVTDANGKAILDQYGNYQGGVRLPAVDVPVAKLFTQGTNCFLWGYKVGFTPELLKQLYPTHKAYVKQVSRKVQDLVAEGWLTEADGKELVIAADASPIPTPIDASQIPILPYSALVPLDASGEHKDDDEH